MSLVHIKVVDYLCFSFEEYDIDQPLLRKYLNSYVPMMT